MKHSTSTESGLNLSLFDGEKSRGQSRYEEWREILILMHGRSSVSVSVGTIKSAAVTLARCPFVSG